MSNYSWKHNTKLNPYFLLKRNKLKPCIASVRDTNANLVRGVYISASISMGIRIRPREPCFLDESSEKESSWQRRLFAGAKCVDTPRGLPSAARSCCTFIKMRLGGGWGWTDTHGDTFAFCSGWKIDIFIGFHMNEYLHDIRIPK